MSDIVKAVIYDRGSKQLNSETKHFSLIAMVLATDEPLVDASNPEIIAMGSLNIYDELKRLPKYEPPYKLGSITGAILAVSNMSPDDLEPYEH